MRLIFDSHLDLSWNALSYNRDQTESVEQINQREAGMTAGGGRGHATTSLPEMRKAGVAVCLGTLLVRAKRHVQPAAGHRRIDLDYGTQSIAYAVAQGQLAYYRLLAEQGEMQMIGTAGELDAHWQRWQPAAARSAADRQHPGHGRGRSDRRPQPGRSLVSPGAAQRDAFALRPKPLFGRHRRKRPAHAPRRRNAQSSSSGSA